MIQNKELKLKFDLLPPSAWGMSLAHKLGDKEWQKVRLEVLTKARFTCQCCDRGHRVLHCHEVWKFDERKKEQILVDLLCLCEDCHLIKHFGRTQTVYGVGSAKVKYLVRHACKVNGTTEKEFWQHYKVALDQVKKRNGIMYLVRVGKKIIV